MATGTGDVFHQELPDLPTELLLLLRCQLQQRLSGVDRIQQCQNVTTILSCSESKKRIRSVLSSVPYNECIYKIIFINNAKTNAARCRAAQEIQ